MEKINDTTYKDVFDEQGIELVVGDEKQENFYPRTKLKKWNNESNISIGIDGNTDSSGIKLDGSKITWRESNNEANFYPLRQQNKPPDRIRWVNLGTLDPLSAAAQFEAFNSKSIGTDLVITTYRVSEPSIMVFGSLPAEHYLSLRATTSKEVNATSLDSSNSITLPKDTKLNIDKTDEEKITFSYEGSNYYIEKKDWSSLTDIRAVDFDHEDKSLYSSANSNFTYYGDLPLVRLSTPSENPSYLDNNIINVAVHVGNVGANAYTEEVWISSVKEVVEELGVKVVRNNNRLLFENVLKYGEVTEVIELTDENGENLLDENGEVLTTTVTKTVPVESELVKFHSGQTRRGVMAFYVNIDAEYNKYFDFYKEVNPTDVRHKNSYGLKKVLPEIDESVISLIVGKFSEKLNIPLEESALSDNEKQKIEKLKTIHSSFNWIENARRNDAGWYHENEKDGFEFEVILEKPPENLTVPFSVQAKNCVFYYQEELSREQRLNWEERSPSVEKSYAVYRYDDKYSRAASKICHIYRPFITDKDGNKYYCEIEVASTEAVDGSTFAIVNAILPKEFSDTSLYPAILDPTIGYNSAGASFQDARNNIVGSIASTGIESGHPKSIYVNSTLWSVGDIPPAKCAIYTSDNNALLVESIKNKEYYANDATNAPNNNWSPSVGGWIRYSFGYDNESIASNGNSNITCGANTGVYLRTDPGGSTVRSWVPNTNNRTIADELTTAETTDGYCKLDGSLGSSNPYSHFIGATDWSADFPSSVIPNTARIVGLRPGWLVSTATGGNDDVYTERIKFFNVNGSFYSFQSATAWPTSGYGSNSDDREENKNNVSYYWPNGDNSGSNAEWRNFGYFDTATKSGEMFNIVEPLTGSDLRNTSFGIGMSITRDASSTNNHRVFALKLQVYWELEVDSTVDILSHTAYKLAYNTSNDNSYGGPEVAYDEQTNPSNQSFQRSYTYNGNFPDPLGTVTQQDRIYSIYLDYQTTGFHLKDTAAVPEVVTAQSQTQTTNEEITKTESSGASDARLITVGLNKLDTIGSLDTNSINTSLTLDDVQGSVDSNSLAASLTLEDSSGTVDIESLLAAFGFTQTDATGSADSLGTPNLGLLKDDVSGLSDNVPAQNLGLSASDILGASDTAPKKAIDIVATAISGAIDTKNIEASLLNTDVSGGLDAISRSIAVSLADSSGAVDIISLQAALNIVNNIGSSELLQRLLQVSISDESGSSDQRSTDLSLSILDNSGVSDVLSKVVGYQQLIADEVGALDSLLLAVTNTISDALGSSELVTLSSGITEEVSITDIAAITDAISVAVTQTISDFLSSSDTASKLAGYDIVTSDSLGLRENIFSGVAIEKLDSLGSLDDRSAAVARTIIDTAGFVDSIARQVGVSALSNVGASDSKVLKAALDFIDAAGNLDEVESQKGLVVAIADALGANDNLTRIHIDRIQSDIVGLLDENTLNTTGLIKIAFFIKEAIETAKFTQETLNQNAKINFTSESLKFTQFIREVLEEKKVKVNFTSESVSSVSFTDQVLKNKKDI